MVLSAEYGVRANYKLSRGYKVLLTLAPSTKEHLPQVQHLLSVRGVYARGSTNAAAKTLFRSQPAISQAIAHMEKHFGTQLFIRGSNGMAATPAGEIVVRRLTRALDHFTAGIGQRTVHGKLYAVGGAQLLALEAVAGAGGFAAAARSMRSSGTIFGHYACLEPTVGR